MATHLAAGLEVALEAGAGVAESPVWDHRDNRLWWVDIHGHRLHRFDPGTAADESWAVNRALGSVVLRETAGVVLALADALEAFDPNAGRGTVLASFQLEGARLNDSSPDPHGRLWVGSMVEGGAPGSGYLYRVDVDRSVHPQLDGISISNGLDWSPDGSVFYYTDSAQGGVEAFDFDPATGEISGRRRLIDVDPKDGLADGLTIDSEGHLWVAICNGGQVRRYRPDGKLDFVLSLPVTRVTSCGFGGADLEDLYITCARRRLSREQLAEQPLAGALFKFRPGVAGVRRRLCAL